MTQILAALIGGNVKVDSTTEKESVEASVGGALALGTVAIAAAAAGFLI